jgi:SAM-dependent methyltransferase
MAKADAFYLQYYEQDAIRHEQVAGEARTAVTLGLIPEAVRTIIDVGCGDGTLLSFIQNERKAFGIDISFTALQRLRSGRGARASAHQLPFGDRSFDCALSTEMIEHLPQGVYEAGLAEIQRVAGEYIVISVPFREDLARKRMRCGQCQHLYHMHYHLRAFDLGTMAKLFPEFEMIQHRFSGPRETTWPKWLLGIRQNVGMRWEWDPNALCPKCGARQNSPSRSALSVVTALAAKVVGKKYPKWVSVLYRRKRGSVL